MATYPTLSRAISNTSTVTVLDDLQVDRASNGTPKVRALYTTPKLAFTVIHPMASAAEKATLQAFYTDNRLLTLAFTWPETGAAYTCLFAAPPRYQPAPGRLWNITVELIQA